MDWIWPMRYGLHKDWVWVSRKPKKKEKCNIRAKDVFEKKKIFSANEGHFFGYGF